ncbi:MAG: hypothetical protein IJX03_06690 [Clostridia bacterium]|nr:hypothetical protein [Clostridia bacterium]
MFYFLTIIISMALISVAGIIFITPISDIEAWRVIVAVIFYTVLEIALNGLFAFIIRRFLPKKWFGVDKLCFVAKSRERNFYDKIKIKKWKDKVLELGCFTNFHKNKIAAPNDNEYVKRYILEANYGVAIHAFLLIASFLIVVVYPSKFQLFFTLPVALVSVFLNLLPLFILRYNLPKLHALYKMNEKRKNK